MVSSLHCIAPHHASVCASTEELEVKPGPIIHSSLNPTSPLARLAGLASKLKRKIPPPFLCALPTPRLIQLPSHSSLLKCVTIHRTKYFDVLIASLLSKFLELWKKGLALSHELCVALNFVCTWLCDLRAARLKAVQQEGEG